MSEVFQNITIVDKTGQTTLQLVGEDGTTLGYQLRTSNPDGKGCISIGMPCQQRAGSVPAMSMTPKTPQQSARYANDIVVMDEQGDEIFVFDESRVLLRIGCTKRGGKIEVSSAGQSLKMDLSEKGIRLFDESGKVAVRIDDRGLFLWDESGNEVFTFDTSTSSLKLGPAALKIRDRAGRTVLKFDDERAILDVGTTGNGGDLIVRDDDNRPVLYFNSSKATLNLGREGKDGRIVLRDVYNRERVILDGNTGDIRLTGADCAELFAVSDRAAPGSVVILDDCGKLRPSEKAYDKRVAGVLSGAGAIKPGLLLNGFSGGDDQAPLSLSGKVLCKVTAAESAIEVGDMLTTSDVPGHAMKAVNSSRAFGTVLGKAMAPHKDGLGLIPVLVALQ